MAQISDFRAQLTQGGARSNQFTVDLTFPTIALGTSNGSDRAASFLCNATSLPAVTVANIPLTYRGRPVNFAGEREFAPWSVTIINDGDFLIRNAFENWSHQVAQFNDTNGTLSPLLYQSNMTVTQLDRNGKALKSYKFFDAYPIEMGAIALAYDNPNIETFDITFQYNYFIPTEISGVVGSNVAIQPVTGSQAG